MPVTKTENDDIVWSIRGVPEQLVQRVKSTARKKGLNIGTVVEMSLKKFFDEEAAELFEEAYVGNKMAEFEARLKALEHSREEEPSPAR